MGRTGGIIDCKRNPFVQDCWIDQEYGLTAKRRRDLETLLRQTCEEILEGDENIRRYPAFVGIRWGFAELQDDTLVPTEKWENRQNYDKFGEPLEGDASGAYSRKNATSTRTSPAPHPRSGSAPAVYSRDTLIKALQSFHPEPVIERYVQNDLSGKSPNTIVSFTMGTSIYRAFRYESPSQRYRNWCWYRRGDSIVSNLNAIETQDAYDRFALELGKSLVADWGTTNERGELSRMNIGIAMKIINLLLKHMTFSGHCNNSLLVSLLHVPWDQYTLRPLLFIWQGSPAIDKAASQGFVKTYDLYLQLHTFITDITQEVGVPRIQYEFFAWDKSHQR